MVNFGAWCSKVLRKSGAHTVQVMTVTDRDSGIENIAATIPDHYDDVAASLDALGKTVSANIIRTILPRSKRIRSADIGEILATEWIDECSGKYRVPVKRLREKVSRESSMHGIDVIGVCDSIDPSVIHFLKCEAKSRASLTPSVVRSAREFLDEGGGSIDNESLTFIIRKLKDKKRELNLATKISKTLIETGLSTSNVQHLVFTVSGNNPTNIIQSSLSLYKGNIDQIYVGVHVSSHQKFIQDIYARVQVNA